MNFAGGVHVQKVTFNNGQEIIGETVGAVTLNGSGTGTMTLSLDPLSVIDTWLKVTLDAGSVSDRAGNALAGGTGGATSFYVGSLRGDFNGDGYVTAADKAGFMAAWNAGSLDADFRGVGYGVRPPDGKITLGDIDGFTSVYLGAVAAGRHLDPLPAGGGPLATGVTPLPGIGRIDGFDVMTAAGQLPMAAGVAWSASDSGDSEDADTPDILAATEPVSADLATLLVVSQPASAAALRI
ncbi:MAG: hypothetical protein NT049_14200 [Planctomycetota bacterium]|nr:hypothetical protein [Planctomycetota bacterium]